MHFCTFYRVVDLHALVVVNLSGEHPVCSVVLKNEGLPSSMAPWLSLDGVEIHIFQSSAQPTFINETVMLSSRCSLRTMTSARISPSASVMRRSESPSSRCSAYAFAPASSARAVAPAKVHAISGPPDRLTLGMVNGSVMVMFMSSLLSFSRGYVVFLTAASNSLRPQSLTDRP